MKNNAGFTLFEVVIAIAILSVLAAIVIFDFVSFKKVSDLDNNVQEFVSALRLAQNRALSSENYSQYGVYINTGVSPNQYVLFKGDSYALRDVPADQTYSLQNTMEFYDISLGGGNQIVFDKLTGASEESGSVSIRVKIDASQNKTVYVASSGAVGFSPPQDTLDANRVKDSRHVQFVYNRNINTDNENIILTFDSSETRTIQINSYLSGDEFRWQDTIDVGGSNQTVEIFIDGLDGSNPSFSIHRDRRYNNKSLDITISGDSSGYLAQYSADGSTTDPSSIYVSGFGWE